MVDSFLVRVLAGVRRFPCRTHRYVKYSFHGDSW
jgi:hypothetical protein